MTPFDFKTQRIENLSALDAGLSKGFSAGETSTHRTEFFTLNVD